MATFPLATLPDVLRRSPYARLLNLEMVRAAADGVVVRMPFREDLIAGDDDAARYVHGGAIASLIDIAGTFAIIAAIGYDAVTVDLRIDYLRPVTSGSLVATGRPVRTGRSLAVADVEVAAEDGKIAAVGRGLFKPQRD
jgi:uncharacterized protein (TIGR00369 family)